MPLFLFVRKGAKPSAACGRRSEAQHGQKQGESKRKRRVRLWFAHGEKRRKKKSLEIQREIPRKQYFPIKVLWVCTLSFKKGCVLYLFPLINPLQQPEVVLAVLGVGGGALKGPLFAAVGVQEQVQHRGGEGGLVGLVRREREGEMILGPVLQG